MASAAVQHPLTGEDFGSARHPEPLPLTDDPQKTTNFPTVPKHDVEAELNFYKDKGDGLPPPPQYVDPLAASKAEQAAVDTRTVTVKDVRGEEHLYSLDGRRSSC
jgi:hypothetical protein